MSVEYHEGDVDASAPQAAPERAEISAAYLADETRLVEQLSAKARFSVSEQQHIQQLAHSLVQSARDGRRSHGYIDDFMGEYGLTSDEGVMLMCLAESLLRVPDSKTADALIAEKLASGNWASHSGKSDNSFVNASTWGLMLTGRVVRLKSDATPRSFIERMVVKSGEPVIREALKRAMRIMGDQFVLGRDIEEALKRSREYAGEGYRFSFDMLGEAAMTRADAERYYNRYLHAAEVIAGVAGPAQDERLATLMERPSLSVKLSAIHPRYEPSQQGVVTDEIYGALLDLVVRMRALGLGFCMDAEEMDRLDMSLEIFQKLAEAPELKGWPGLGLAVQAYSKRAMPVLSWLRRLAERESRVLPVRLVKGAYWDSEIKWAQEAGLSDYPVFTRKRNTDISYLACMRFLMSEPGAFYPQLATHNSHSIASTFVTGRHQAFEFQRLHGMGEAIYEDVVSDDKLNWPVRIYAPVGGHDDLLAYLVRRLLENGANSSFINRLRDDEEPIDDIIADPVARSDEDGIKRHPAISLPRDLFQPERPNSEGELLTDRVQRAQILRAIGAKFEESWSAGPIVNGEQRSGAETIIRAPHDSRVAVGTVVTATARDVDDALTAASAAQWQWDRAGGVQRAELLEAAADLYETRRHELMGVIVREAGKTLANAEGDVREAVDFLRYYAAQARLGFDHPRSMPGVTGETNELSLHGRGVFACISPWNFPLAIFTGQISAALAAGNTVVAKPADQTPLTAALGVRLLHEAGIPRAALHLLPGAGPEIGKLLVEDARVSGVAFTGSTEVSRSINQALAARGGPIIPFIAETGGINAMIVDSSALPEQVTRDVVRSAFDSAGQRCSAARVLFVQEDIVGRLLPMLSGAVEELVIGDPLDFATDVGPVIDEAAEERLNAHKHRMGRSGQVIVDRDVPAFCRSGTYVTPSIFEITSLEPLEREVFGPILHVIRYSANKIDDVIGAINGSGYGLTLGIHSRIEGFASYVADRARVGNVYVNRDQIGAVVGSQPFGGEGLSGTGPKAGGPGTLSRYAVERVRTVNVTATGGNVGLLGL